MEQHIVQLEYDDHVLDMYHTMIHIYEVAVTLILFVLVMEEILAYD